MMMNMKILHVCNTAGVGSIIAKFMDKLFSTESLVVQRRASDPFGLTTYGELWDCGAKMFTLKCLLRARRFDIVHVHYFDKIIPFLKFLYPKKPVVVHYHGDDIRDKWSSKRKYWSKTNLILYSTLDLLDDKTPERAVHLPNPVDTEVFHFCSVKRKPKTAFHFSYYADDLAEKYAEKFGLELTIYNWRNEGKIPYLKLPEVLCQYEYYIDVKRDSEGRAIPALSKVGLEALACGLKVVTWNGDLIEKLPKENDPVVVARKLWALYQKIIK